MEKVIVVRKRPKRLQNALMKGTQNERLEKINNEVRRQYLFNVEAFMKLQDEKIARGEMPAEEKWWPDASTT